MRLFTRIATLAMALSVSASCARSRGEEEASPPTTGFAVVELFTSEGCSSCPPADALLAKLDAEADAAGQRVYCLSFHVDYWNQLGWADLFSAPAYTLRQRAYVRNLNLRSAYTPQMVVDGTDEFVGSDSARAATAIRTSLARESSTSVAVKAVADDENVTVDYQVEGAPAGAVLCVAWTLAEALSAPDRGENDGRKLRHVNVVRDFRMVELKAPFTGNVSLKRADVGDGSVIAYVQQAPAGAVLAATAQDVSPSR